MTEERNGTPIERAELARLKDIRTAIEKIETHPRFPDGQKAWNEDEYFRGYCERQLSIVGEAASKLSTEFGYETKYPDLEWPLIRGLRTILVHVYWRVDPKILWSVIEKHVPELKKRVNEWIEERQLELKDTPMGESKPKKESKLLRKIREAAERERPTRDEE